MMVTVGAVQVFARLLDGGDVFRCDNCLHPYRHHHHRGQGVTHGHCPVCGARRTGSVPCTAEAYRASRTDDAPVPCTAD